MQPTLPPSPPSTSVGTKPSEVADSKTESPPGPSTGEGLTAHQPQNAQLDNLYPVSVPAVSVLQLHKHYGNNHVLKGVSMQAVDHDIITIIGRSGSGKSTLLRCLNLLEMPDSGEIRIKDELLQVHHGKRYSRPAHFAQINRIRAKIGMVFQHFNLWPHLSLLENVIEAPVHVLKIPKKIAIEKAENLLERVGMYHKKDAYPAYLSGGEKQRGAIARTLAMEPQVILFDEPTSSLDPERVGEVLKVIRNLAEEGRTMILVTHEMRFAKEISTDVLYLAKGTIVEQGPPEQVLADPQTEQCRKFLQLEKIL